MAKSYRADECTHPPDDSGEPGGHKWCRKAACVGLLPKAFHGNTPGRIALVATVFASHMADEDLFPRIFSEGEDLHGPY